MKRIFIILICLLIASPAFAGKKPKKSPLYKLQKQLGNGEMISLPSYSTTTFMGIHEGWYHTFTGNYEPEKSPAQVFHRCPPIYSKDNGQWSDEIINFMIKHGSFKSREEFELAQKEDPRAAWKKGFAAAKKAKCIDKGVTEGGNHGKTFMPEYLKFWKDNLL